MNLYGYVGGDPINLVDPWGLQASDCIPPQCTEGPEIGVTGQRPRRRPIAGAGPSSAGNFMDGWLGQNDPARMLTSLIRPARINEDPIDLGTMEEVLATCDRICQQEGAIARWRHQNDARMFGQFLQLTWEQGGWAFAPQFRGLGVAGDVIAACGCFVEGTEIATPQGLRPIEELKIGDLVLAYNEGTGTSEQKVVTGLLRPAPRPTLVISLIGRLGPETLRVTQDHPLLVEGKGWVLASRISEGDNIVTNDGSVATVQRMRASGQIEQTYNIEVEGLHTYSVGKYGIVVHNGWCKGTFETLEESLEYHFKKHGPNLGSVDAAHYARQAEGFAQNLSRASRAFLEGGAVRYTKNGKFLIVNSRGEILSFGRVN